MDLIDRYVIAVRRQLPKPLQDDVIMELSDSLRSEAEEHEQRTGHPLTTAEQATLLKKRGHPWLMASRYLPQQHLIGPALFPYYRQALKAAVFWVVLPITLFGGALNAIYSADPTGVWAKVLGSAWNGAIYAVGSVTIIFAILDHEKLRITVLDSWNPEKLPEPQPGRPIPRADTVIGLVFALSILVWWAGVVRTPDLAHYAGEAVRFEAAPIWNTMYYPILLVLISSCGVYLIDLVRPWRTISVSIFDLALNLASVAIITMILRAGHYVNVVGPSELGDRLAKADYWLNAAIGWALMIAGAIAIVEVLNEIWKMTKSRGSSSVVAC